jgi:phosphoribosylamine--glycine ligase
VCAIADDLAAARLHAYQRIDSIRWKGMFFRKDIGARGLEGTRA